MMDDLYAPQWVDFTSSPQLPSDSYFEVEHEVHEPLPQPKLSEPKIRLPDKIQVCEKQDAKVTNECAEVVESPKIAFFVPCGDNTKNVAQATTLDSLPDEVKNLQICAKARRSNLSLNIQGKRNSQTESEQKTDYGDHINKTICGNFPAKYLTSEYRVEPVEIPGNIITVVKEEEPETHLVPDQSPKSANNEIDKRLSYKIIRRQSNKIIRRQSNKIIRRQSNKIIRAQLNAVRVKRSSLTNSGPRVLTSQYRRRSLNKYRRRSKQFISLAEAVTKFHTATPDRFRTLSQKDVKSAANSKYKRMPPKLTFPVSPALRCKKRTRIAAVITKEQQELKELEEMKKHQIKAKPVPAGLLKAPAPLKKIGKKPPTVTEEFHLTQCKKRQTAPVTCTSTKQRGIKKEDPPKNISSVPSLTAANKKTKPVQNVEQKHSIPVVRSEKSHSQASIDRIKLTQSQLSRRTMGHIISLSKPVDKKQDQSKSALPLAASTGSSCVSKQFEARKKEYQQKKEEKMRNLQIQETSKNKAEFHARPVPKFSKPSGPPKEHLIKKPLITCPFSFEQRDKNLATKKEQHVKQILEERGKLPKFHANPLPSFIYGGSKEISKSKEKMMKGTKSLSTMNVADQENKQPNIIEIKREIGIVKPLINEKNGARVRSKSIELNTDKRAKERYGFDKKLKKKAEEEKLKRQEEEKQRLAREKLERAELRKQAEIKARPMPVYKPLLIRKSTKPPTSPKSPAQARKLKSKHVC